MTSLDIVIVNWNAGGQLLDCIRSLEALQTEPVFQVSRCVVVDNASADHSADELGPFPFDLAFVRNLENRGFGSACNQGAAIGQADYVLFLNPDTMMFPDSLAKAISFLENPQNRRIGILGIQLVDKDCNVQPSAGRFPTPESLIYQMIGLDRIWPARFPPFAQTDWDHKESREVDLVQGAFLLLRRAAFDELKGFDEQFFMYFEDVDLAHRAREAGWSIWYFAEAQAFHRGGGVTESIKADRLFFWLRSRAQYAAAHFGKLTCAAVVLTSLSLELVSRLLWNLARLSGLHLVDTLRAYRKYLVALPELLRS